MSSENNLDQDKHKSKFKRHVVVLTTRDVCPHSAIRQFSGSVRYTGFRQNYCALEWSEKSSLFSCWNTITSYNKNDLQWKYESFK